MLARILSAVVALPLVILVIERGDWLFAGVVLVVSGICLHEFASMTLPSDVWSRFTPVALGLVIVLFGLTGFLASSATLPLLALFFLVLLVVNLFRFNEISKAASNMGLGALGMIWVGTLIGSTAMLRLLPHGEVWFYLACVLAWGSDTGAYFSGRFFGRRRLYEEVSPKKTWEGAVGGVVVATAGAFVLLAAFGYPAIPSVHLAILAPMAAALGQVGDLAESLLKRSVGVKDSGRIMPGHGGLLDRLDALAFIGPVLLLYGIFVLRLEPTWLLLPY